MIRRRRHDRDLAVDVVDVVGYRGSCGGHWRGPSRPTWSAARQDLTNHRRERHN